MQGVFYRYLYNYFLPSVSIFLLQMHASHSGVRCNPWPPGYPLMKNAIDQSRVPALRSPARHAFYCQGHLPVPRSSLRPLVTDPLLAIPIAQAKGRARQRAGATRWR